MKDTLFVCLNVPVSQGRQPLLTKYCPRPTYQPRSFFLPFPPSSGKTLPQWLSEKKRRSLSKDVEYRRRIELLQDFDFPTASQRVQASADGQYVIVTGTYPPQVKGEATHHH